MDTGINRKLVISRKTIVGNNFGVKYSGDYIFLEKLCLIYTMVYVLRCSHTFQGEDNGELL